MCQLLARRWVRSGGVGGCSHRRRAPDAAYHRHRRGRHHGRPPQAPAAGCKGVQQNEALEVYSILHSTILSVLLVMILMTVMSELLVCGVYV